MALSFFLSFFLSLFSFLFFSSFFLLSPSSSSSSYSTSFPGSLLFTPQEAREGRPWLGLVTCLPKSGRLQISDWREGQLSVSLPILSVPGMGKHASVRINLQNRACFKGHVKWSRNPQKDV